MSENDIFEMMEKDSKPADPENSLRKLKEISDVVKRMVKAQENVEAMENDLKEAKAALAEIQEKILPDMFDEIGLSEIKLDDGSKVTIDKSYQASITQANTDSAFAWLRQNGHESLIKHEVVASLKKGQDEKAVEILAYLKENEIVSTDRQSVHASTLKAFVKEQIESGADLPMDLFSVFEVRKAKVKQPK